MSISMVSQENNYVVTYVLGDLIDIYRQDWVSDKRGHDVGWNTRAPVVRLGAFVISELLDTRALEHHQEAAWEHLYQGSE